MTITRVGPLSCAKVAGLLYVVIGLIAGGLFSLFAMAGGLAAAAGSDGNGAAGGFAALFGIGAVIILPICYGIFGFIGTLIMASLFNVAAGIVGGIEVDAG